MSFLTTTLIINEVFPNPSSGNEWVEIYYLGDDVLNSSDYQDFSISDDKRVIYKFEGDESWSDNFLIVELTGLNNDKDSVILKNSEEVIIDAMDYNSSEKDLSWLRTDPNDAIFILGEPTPLFENIIPTPSLIPTSYPSPTQSLTPSSPTASITPTSDTPPSLTTTNNETNNDQIKTYNQNQLVSATDLSQIYFANYQGYKNLEMTCSQEKQFRQSRLVFLGQKILKRAIIDAIIGSFLLVIAAVLLSYEYNTKKEKKDNFILF